MKTLSRGEWNRWSWRGNKSHRNSSKTNFIRLKAKSTCALFCVYWGYLFRQMNVERDANQVMVPQNACHSPPHFRWAFQMSLPCGLFKLNSACEEKAVISGNLIMNPHAIRFTYILVYLQMDPVFSYVIAGLSNQISSANRRINLWYMQRTRLHDGRTNGPVSLQVIPLWGHRICKNNNNNNNDIYMVVYDMDGISQSPLQLREKLKVIFHIVAQSKPMKLQLAREL